MDAILAPLADSKSFQSFAGAASIFSLILTGFVVWKLRRINMQLIFRQRSRRWLVQLRSNADRLAPLLTDPAGGGQTIRVLLAESRPTVLAVHRCLPRFSAQRARTGDLLAKIGRYLSGGPKISLLRRIPLNGLPRAIYEDMLEVNQTLSEDVEQGRIFQPRV